VAYKFRDGWIPVPLPPPLLSGPTFSAAFRAHKNPQLRRAFARKAPDWETPSEIQILSLGPFFSKAPDFADLVRNS
jgi:hypothetical protein